MKKGYLILVLAMVICVSQATAQVTIDSNEWPATIGTQRSFYNSEDTLGAGIPINLGTTGGPQTWTFSETMFPGGIHSGLTIIDPANAPFASQFPNADHVWYMQAQIGSFMYEDWSYLDLTPTALLSLGYAQNLGTTIIMEDNIPDDLAVQFPATLGTSWTSNYSVTTIPFPGALQVDSTSRSSMVDAWGTINLPTGSFDCLRVRDDEISYYNFYVSGILVSSDTIFSYTYSWIAEQEGLLVNVISLEDETNPNFTLKFGPLMF